MSRLTVDVPDSVLGEEKAKEIKSLRSKVARLEEKNRKLERRLQDGQELVTACKALREHCKETFGFYEGDDFKSWDL